MSVLSYLYHWLGDEAVIRRHLDRAERAIGWIDHAGDRDRDGFQEYETRSAHGYYNQGWKDAGDAIPHEDGSLAPLPLALCELQGYVYDAKLRMADLYDVIGRPEDAARLRDAGADPVRPVQRRVLVGGGGHVLPRARRRQAADPLGRLERGPPAPVRDRAARARRAGRGAAPARRHVVGVGDPDPVVRSRGLQPVLVPHGDGLAARQRGDRGRLPALRLRRAGGPGRGWAVRRLVPARRRAAARAVRGPAAPRGVVPGPVPGRERAPGVGGQRDPPIRGRDGRHPRPHRGRQGPAVR